MRRPQCIPHRCLIALSFAAALALGNSVRADAIYWQGGVDDWFNAGNWTDVSQAGISVLPGSADLVFVENGEGPVISSGNAAASAEFIGASGRTGTLSQSGGTNTTPDFELGDISGSTGAYTLSGTGILSVSDTESVGANGATGNFIQSGGTNTNSFLYLGENSGSTGTYSLSGTGALTAGQEVIGLGGTGFFSHAGGTNTTNNLVLGGPSGSMGTYSLSGTGALTAGQEVIGIVGTGIFNQSGGTNKITGGGLFLGEVSGGVAGSGTYSLSGSGSLSTGYEEIGSGGTGTFNQSGGTNTTSQLNIGQASGSTDVYSLSGTGSLSVAEVESVGIVGTGNFNESGGTNTTGGIELGANSGTTGIYTLSGTGVVIVNNDGDEVVGSSGAGIFIQNGGTNTIASGFGSLQISANPGSSGTYTLNNGSFSADSESIGYAGAGTFNQSGGTNTTSAINMGTTSNASGTYMLSATATLSSDFEDVGLGGTANFIQSCQSSNTTTDLELGDSNTATGTYTLSDTGILSVNGDELVGEEGTGIFTQAGGTNTATGKLALGDEDGSSGTYNLNAGSLSAAAKENIGESGSGTFNQSGGANVTPQLTLSDRNGAATYNLSGTGMLSVTGPFEFIGQGGPGSFSQTGGTHTVGVPTANAYLVLAASPGSSGNYTLSTGTLSVVAGYELIGFADAGTFNQSGGTNTVGSAGVGEMDIAASPGSNGAYTLSGGTLTVNGNLYVGGGTISTPDGSPVTQNPTPGGAGTLTVSHTGQLNVAGTLQVFSTGQFNLDGGVTTANILNLTDGSYTQTAGTASFSQITGTGQISLTGGQTTLSAGGNSSQINALTLSGSGTLDLTDGTLAIHYSGTSPADMIHQYLASGYDHGNWDGPGINSSSAAANPAASLGYIDTGAQIIIQYTLLGDANMDGKINADDYALIDRGLAKHLTGWQNGDFNYDGVVDQNDYLLIDRAYLLTQAPGFNPDSLLSQRDSQFGDAYVSSLLASVPEPSLLAACGLALPLLTRRRLTKKSCV